MTKFPVSPNKQRELDMMMQRLGVRETDFEESFIRSSGPGGQNVNKVATCVVLRHRPSGLEVRCQRERSQVLNRFLARRILLQRLEVQRLGRLAAEAQRIAKLRRQAQAVQAGEGEVAARQAVSCREEGAARSCLIGRPVSSLTPHNRLQWGTRF